MPFILPGGSSDVISVNEQRGQVILNHKDVGAVANILDSCGGIQVGTTNERPSSAKDNVLYIVTDTTPNRFYRYSEELGKWDLIGGAGGEGGTAPTDLWAIDVSFNSNGTILDSGNVQNAILELHGIIERNQYDLISTIEKNNGKVKLNELDTAGYLNDKIDNITLQIENDRIVVKGLDGLSATTRELNQLRGAKSNIQRQIDSLSNVGNFTEAVGTYAELTTIQDPVVNDMTIVIEDESREGQSAIYMHNGSEWVFVGKFSAEVRDFSTNPIDLTTEIKGILSESSIDSSIARKSDLTEIMKTTDGVEEGNNNLYYTENRVSNNTDVKSNTRARHTHQNRNVINALSENPEGKLLYKGSLIEGAGGEGTVDWKEF